MQLNIKQIIDNNGGDRDLVESIANIFLNNHQMLIDNILDASQNNDCDKLWKAAHTLRGTVNYFLVDDITKLVEEIEQNAKSGNIDKCSSCKVEELVSLISELATSLKQMCLP